MSDLFFVTSVHSTPVVIVYVVLLLALFLGINYYKTRKAESADTAVHY